MKLFLLSHIAATLFMFGVIMVIQVVHYPLFADVGSDVFVAYEGRHTRLITWVVLLPMTIELLTAIALVFERPSFLPGWEVWAGLVLVGVIWLSTAVFQVPLHGQLAKRFDPDLIQQLVSTNWIRTVAWALRSALVLWWLSRLLPSDSL